MTKMKELKRSLIGIAFILLWALIVVIFNLPDNLLIKGIGIAIGVALGIWLGSRD